MLSSTSFWMCLAGFVYLVAGVFVFRKEIGAARGWNRLIALGCVFFAASLAAFAPEHFYGGPEYIPKMVPSWMPVHSFWPYFVGCALLAAATSLTLRKFVRLSSTLLVIDKKARVAAASIGLVMTTLTLLLYVPMLAMASQPPQMLEAVNYVADTLLFAGAALLVAGALPEDAPLGRGARAA